MIFLTVSAVVFLGAIQQYSGQQRTVQANQGFRTLQSQLTSLVNEVATSYPPSLGAIVHCHAAPVNTNPPLTFDTIGADNSDCIFVGKVFSYGFSSFCTNANADSCGNYTTGSVIGRRLAYAGASTQGSSVTTFTEAKPVLLAGPPSASNPPSSLEMANLLNGVGIYKAFIRSATGTNAGDPNGLGAFAFTLSLTGDGGSSGQVNLVTLDPTFTANSTAILSTSVTALNSINDLSTINVLSPITRINPAYGIALCLASGSSQFSEITVGANNNPTDIQVVPTSKIDSECNLS